MHGDDTIRKPLNAPSSRELSSEARLRELHRVCPVETFEYKVFKSATEPAGETLPPP